MKKEKKKGEKKSDPEASSSIEEVCEVFNIEKEGKIETKKVCATEEKKPATKKQIKEQEKILRNFLIGLGVLVLFVVGWFIGSHHLTTFNYQKLDFEIIKEGEVTFYHTVIPIYSNGAHTSNHNVFLRNDPRKLEKEVEFIGDLELTGMMVMDGLDKFNCGGDGIVSQASFQQVINAFGTKIIRDPEAGCDEYGRYNFVELVEAEETRIIALDPTCHLIQIKDCEIFQAKERFLLKEMEKIR